MKRLRTKHIKGRTIRNIDFENLYTYLSKHILWSTLCYNALLMLLTFPPILAIENTKPVSTLSFILLVINELILIGLLWGMTILTVDLIFIISPLALSKKSHTYATVVDITNPKKMIISIENTEYTIKTDERTISSLNLHDNQQIIIYSLQSKLGIYSPKNQSY